MPHDNPFTAIHERFDRLEKLLQKAGITQPPEIIDRKELAKRLSITEQTVLKWEKKKKIPSFRIGSAVRYNWNKVIKAIE